MRPPGNVITTDVVVLGAGAAGLVALRSLDRAGVHAIGLEARGRIGGRLLTIDEPGLPVPVDLGGEFVHGTAPISFELLRAAGTVAIDTAGEAFAYENGCLVEREDTFATTERALTRAHTLREDMSIDEFLRDADERERRFVRMMVEGFDAADPARASTLALAQEWNGSNGGQTSRQFRPLGGYGPVLHALHEALDPARIDIRLNTLVTAIRRTDGGVQVDATTHGGAPLTVRARLAIVTLPLGVLQTASPDFDPPLPAAKHEALAQLVMGPVVKLVLRFRSAFWERVRDGAWCDAGFFYRAEATFPTFWALLPLRTPILIAWAGGPKAEAMAAYDRDRCVAAALDDLDVLFNGEADPHGELEAAYSHNWQADPLAYGAYSYAAVGGAGARAALAAPVDDLLFFAGEATAPASEAGTVAGALQSGARAAREALAVIARER